MDRFVALLEAAAAGAEAHRQGLRRDDDHSLTSAWEHESGGDWDGILRVISREEARSAWEIGYEDAERGLCGD